MDLVSSSNQDAVNIARLASDLIRIKSVNSSDVQDIHTNTGLYEVACFVKEWISKNSSAKVKIVEFKKGFPIVIADDGGNGKKVLLNGHMDVVPVNPKDNKNMDYFSGKIIRNKLFGRGAADMKTGLATFMYILSKLGDNSTYNLMFTAVSDEETGGYFGSKYLAMQLKPDIVFVGEPTTAGFFGVGEKGVLQVMLKAKGKSAHSSLPSEGINAITKITNDLTSIMKIQDYTYRTPPYARNSIKNSLCLYGEDVRKITCTPSMISGGIKLNIVPSYCEASVNIRLPIGTNVERVTKLVEAQLKESDMVQVASAEPSFTNNKSLFIKRLLNLNGAHTLTIKPIILSGATDGRYFRYVGIPTVVYGPGDLKMAHTDNEYVVLSDVAKVYKTYFSLLS